ncbi:potassium ABC transporter ATPase [[Pantoea] beijingensis]|uniref:Potassium ABC transporter ATPase n=1 Tax=[Pantoea] beijingensis TaxID=1324864 RepID=A0A443ICX5_9GAMM|nr:MULTISPECIES: prepilin peptidase-dependent protein [Erwiniaceae]RWR01740.1 potassium ABC transporter ATPase [[Pantoea] beijingensis]
MKCKASQGFTLPEILITLAIVGILSQSAFYSWHQWQQQRRLAETSLHIQRFLYRLRAWANWHNNEQVLWHQPGEYWCLGSGDKPATGCEAGRRRQLIALYPDVKITHVTRDMGFYGKRNVAKPGSIEFANAAGRWRIIVSARGRIRLCKPEREPCFERTGI